MILTGRSRSGLAVTITSVHFISSTVEERRPFQHITARISHMLHTFPHTAVEWYYGQLDLEHDVVCVFDCAGCYSQHIPEYGMVKVVTS